MVPLSFGGHDFQALSEGALFWPVHSALLVADLHLEKASWLAGGGQFLPPYDSIATLEALAALATRTGARAIWCLGDSFHDVGGGERLPGAAQALPGAALAVVTTEMPDTARPAASKREKGADIGTRWSIGYGFDDKRFRQRPSAIQRPPINR